MELKVNNWVLGASDSWLRVMSVKMCFLRWFNNLGSLCGLWLCHAELVVIILNFKLWKGIYIWKGIWKKAATSRIMCSCVLVCSDLHFCLPSFIISFMHIPFRKCIHVVIYSLDKKNCVFDHRNALMPVDLKKNKIDVLDLVSEFVTTKTKYMLILK